MKALVVYESMFGNSSAAKGAAKLGFSLLAKPMSFFVDGVNGPLLAGEKERARLWGDKLGAEATRLGSLKQR